MRDYILPSICRKRMLTMLKNFDNVENLDNEGLDPPKYLQKEDLVFMTKGTV